MSQAQLFYSGFSSLKSKLKFFLPIHASQDIRLFIIFYIICFYLREKPPFDHFIRHKHGRMFSCQ